MCIKREATTFFYKLPIISLIKSLLKEPDVVLVAEGNHSNWLIIIIINTIVIYLFILRYNN